jgi:hypothetical protein
MSRPQDVDPDPFEDVLNVEEQLYQQGYEEGLQDGEQAGKIEGRQFGLEQGFQKYLESGRLYGKTLVWANRLPPKSLERDSEAAATATDIAPATPLLDDNRKLCELPQLPRHSRLEKNIAIVHALVEPETLPTENTEEAVTDFDDRLKRAQAKAKVIAQTVGEKELKSEILSVVSGALPSSSEEGGAGASSAAVEAHKSPPVAVAKNDN